LIKLILFGCALAIAFGSSPLLAQGKGEQVLNERIEKLEAQIAELQKLVRESLITRSEEPAPSQTVAATSTTETVPAEPVATTEASETAFAQLIAATRESKRIQPYGFLRFDVNYDTAEPNNNQTPMFIPSDAVQPSGGKSLTMYPRMTRLGANFNGGVIDLFGAELTGKVELDFHGGGSESRNLLRMRKAYMKLAWEEFELLIGQDSDTFSPLYPSVNADMINWGAGNSGDRRPQIRFSYQPTIGATNFNAQFALAQQSAIDNQDLDGEGILDGEESGHPQIQVRLGLSTPSILTDAPVEFGAWYVNGKEEADLNLVTDIEHDAELYGIDFNIPLIDHRLWIKGEAWSGKNGDDLRVGIGQGLRNDGKDLEATGGWIELGYKPTASVRLVTGYSVDNPDDEDAAAASGRSKNRLYYVGAEYNRYNPFVVGAEYINWETEYVDLPSGEDHRVKLYFLYNF
jgi:hypothetical protein